MCVCVCVLVFYLHICYMYHIRTWYPWKPEEGHRSAETEVTGGCQLSECERPGAVYS